MHRRAFIAASALVVLDPRALGAQPSPLPVVGALWPTREAPIARLIGAFSEGLLALGYVAGRNVRLEERSAEGQPERLAELAADLVRLKPAAIVTAGEAPIRVLMKATNTIPIVMAATGDAVADRFVASLSRPGGNVTGLTVASPEVWGKRVQLFKEAVPVLKRVAVLWNVANPVKRRDLGEVEKAARALGITVHPAEVSPPDRLDAGFATVVAARPQGLITLTDEFMIGHAGRVSGFARAHRLPTMYEAREFVDAGGLMCYGPDLRDLFRRAASYVDKILKGAPPAELPVEQPSRFELVINQRTAKALGLAVSPSLLQRADRIVS